MLTKSSLIAAFGRILIAVIFLVAGYGKITTPETTQASIASVGLPFPILAYWIAVAIEIGGGALLALGYRSRLTAFIIAVFTVTAAAAYHHNFTDQGQMMNFLKDIAITGGLLQVIAFGAGKLSIDAYSGRL